MCPSHFGQVVDEGPDCCDLSCRLGDQEPLLWDGDQN